MSFGRKHGGRRVSWFLFRDKSEPNAREFAILFLMIFCVEIGRGVSPNPTVLKHYLPKQRGLGGFTFEVALLVSSHGSVTKVRRAWLTMFKE